MACLSLFLPSFERWERPSAASLSASSDQSGRFEQGPEEKCVFAGRTAGLASSTMINYPSRYMASRWGEVSRRRKYGKGEFKSSAFWRNWKIKCRNEKAG